MDKILCLLLCFVARDVLANFASEMKFKLKYIISNATYKYKISEDLRNFISTIFKRGLIIKIQLNLYNIINVKA